MNNKITFHNTKDIEEMLPKINDILFQRFNTDPKITILAALLVGISNRTYELTESAIWSIENNRPITAALVIRGLYETLAYIAYLEMKISKASIKDKIDIIENALFGSRRSEDLHSQISILTCLDKASKMFPDLRKNYDEICEVVHPNSASHLAPIHAKNRESREATIMIPRYEFKNDDKKIFINHAGECCYHIIAICERMIKIS